MAKLGVDIYDFTYKIPYHPEEILSNDNPFDCTAALLTEKYNSELAALSENYDRLLYWLSASGSGTLESFKKACQTLELSEPRRILRRLKLLGHIESSSNGSRWSSTPAALVRVNSAPDTLDFLLCGQRSQELLHKLEHESKVVYLNQAQGDAPLCVRLQLDSLEEFPPLITSIKNQLNIPIIDAGESSLKLAEILPDLIAWKQGLRCLPGIVPSLYEWKRFEGREFVESSFPQQTGMYEMWDFKKDARPVQILFYDSETDTWRQGDWYGLRFLALHYNNCPCIARYDATNARLAVPYSQRWPELYERALVLASGLLPSYQKTEQNLWLIYENVGQNLAHQLTQKLYVTCEGGTTECTI
ncbi:hypothetical protein [Oscillatoria sp. FACHB-1406]|uniref:hypothetical protein n=1 Tax=Oscillatoria sp. FACHB-1406 TaxID=2692846 RepID=UPI001688F04B|nr:hypothetical protein [Oscillatoria sp. FACHB-1406]MBD2580161.1 hypothetical protein [Oscillatoria sp. FACHB-1406]